MRKLEVLKSIEAVKLNRRSKLAVQEPPVTIPYGAIVQDLDEGGDLVRFTYLGDLYQCAAELLRNATAQATPSAAASPKSDPPADVSFRWECLPTSLKPLWRAKVPGGWLLTMGDALAFYPDPGHGWDGRNLE